MRAVPVLLVFAIFAIFPLVAATNGILRISPNGMQPKYVELIAPAHLLVKFEGHHSLTQGNNCVSGGLLDLEGQDEEKTMIIGPGNYPVFSRIGNDCKSGVTGLIKVFPEKTALPLQQQQQQQQQPYYPNYNGGSSMPLSPAPQQAPPAPPGSPSFQKSINSANLSLGASPANSYWQTFVVGQMLTVRISDAMMKERQIRQQKRFADVQGWERQLGGMVGSSSRIFPSLLLPGFSSLYLLI